MSWCLAFTCPLLGAFCANDTAVENLEHLGITVAPKLDGSGFRHLAGLKKLKSVVLEGCALTDDGLKGLGELDSVELLYMGDPNIGDAGVAHL